MLTIPKTITKLLPFTFLTAIILSILKFEKPIPKGEVKLVPADDVDQLIDLLHNEANVI